MFSIFLTHTFLLVLVISAIPLVCGSICALFVAVLQAATQVQEQSIGYLVRLLAVAGTFYFVGERFAFEIIQFFQETLATIEFLAWM